MNQLEIVLIAGGITAAVLFVLFGEVKSPSHRRRTTTGNTNKGIPSGLMNFGTTCFFNCILQALASCSEFCVWISSSQYVINPTQDNCITVLNQLIRGINHSEAQLSNTRLLSQLLDMIRNSGWVVEDRQQDAHELFQALVSLLCPSTASSDFFQSLSDADLCTEILKADIKPSVIHKPGINYSMDKSEENRLPFHGYTYSSMRCRTCLNKTVTKYDVFTSLSLHLPPQRIGPFQLDDLLKHYFLTESLPDVNCESCQKTCQPGYLAKSDFIRELGIGRAPKCLSIHIQRVGWYQEALKRHDKVIFPSLLDISLHTQVSKLVSQNKLAQSVKQLQSSHSFNEFPERGYTETVKPCWYRLKAVIEHLGSEDSGHFTTYRYMENGEDSKWIYTSDLEVEEVSAHHVHTRSPYMLFYERTQL